MLADWAYGAIYGTSPERAAALDGWLWTYNHRRPHGSLGHMTCSPAVLTVQAAGIRWVGPPSFQVAATSRGVR